MAKEEQYGVNRDFYVGRGRSGGVTYNLHARNETDMGILEKTMDSLNTAYDICVPARKPVNVYLAKTGRRPKGSDVHQIWVFGKNITQIVQMYNPNETNVCNILRDKKLVRLGVSSKKPLTLFGFSPGYVTSFNFGKACIVIQHQYEDLGGFKEGLKNKNRRKK